MSLSDITKVAVTGRELAVAGGTLSVVAVNGKELATVANAGLATAANASKDV